MFSEALRKARSRADKREVPFNIDKEYLISLFKDQEGKCYYSGVQLNIVKKKTGVINDPMKMTLDCIEPGVGYIKGNVVWCAYCVNVFKQKMSVSEMVQICGGIIKTSSENKV
jgi:hypothetical protein